MSDTLVEDIAHAPYGPSAAEGWSGCLDYVNANRGLPDKQLKVAAEGTFAHAISDECLLLGASAYDYVGQRLRVADWTFAWTTDDADLLQPGLDWISAQQGTFYGEQRVDISRWTIPGQFGTLDRAVAAPELIIVEDLKWGRGIPINPIRNKQLVLYALGLWDRVKHLYTDPPSFRLRIDQPRCAGGGGDWDTTLDGLIEIGDWLRSRAHLGSTMENPPRTASEKACMWCRRKGAPGGCNTYEQWRVETLGLQFDDLDIDVSEAPMLAGAMTPERRAYLVMHAAGIKRWLEGHADAALDDALHGRDAGGLKAVVDNRKGTRDKWKEKADVETVLTPLLGDNSFTKKLITPTQACKQVSDEDRPSLTALIDVGVKGHSLVPAEDARSAVVRVEADDFDDL